MCLYLCVQPQLPWGRVTTWRHLGNQSIAFRAHRVGDYAHAVICYLGSRSCMLHTAPHHAEPYHTRVPPPRYTPAWTCKIIIVWIVWSVGGTQPSRRKPARFVALAVFGSPAAGIGVEGTSVLKHTHTDTHCPSQNRIKHIHHHHQHLLMCSAHQPRKFRIAGRSIRRAQPSRRRVPQIAFGCCVSIFFCLIYEIVRAPLWLCDICEK